MYMSVYAAFYWCFDIDQLDTLMLVSRSYVKKIKRGYLIYY